MSNEIALIKNNWLEIAKSAADLPRPFQNEIFLQECPVAGTLYVDDILEKVTLADEGKYLQLKRETDNEYDEFAISVQTASGEHIGYVPRRYNQVFARLMDAGKLLIAKFSKIDLKDHWLDINIKIILRDV